MNLSRTLGEPQGNSEGTFRKPLGNLDETQGNLKEILGEPWKSQWNFVETLKELCGNLKGNIKGNYKANLRELGEP